MNKLLIAISISTLLFACSTSKIEKKFTKDQFQGIIDAYGKSINKNSALENFLVGEAYRKSNRIEKSSPFYESAISQHIKNERAHIYLSQSLKAQKKYTEAKRILENYIATSTDSTALLAALQEKENLNELGKIKTAKNFFRIKNLADANTRYAEYSAVYKNGKLYFVSNRETDKIHKSIGVPFTDIYEVESKGAKVKLSTLKKLPQVINEDNANEGSMTFSRDGNTMIFARGNTGKARGYNEVNLYFSRFRNNRWSKPKPLEVNEPNSWNSCPSLSPNGRTLYFASNRDGGYGGTDLYAASLDKRGRWVDVRNLGPKINTSGNELFPFLSKDGSFYFSSDGHQGLGKQDIFVETRTKGQVVIKNMGIPINSEGDDLGVFFFDEVRGFLISNRPGGKGDDDIYTFTNEDPDLKIVNYYLVGTVFHETDSAREIIRDAKVVLMDSNNEILEETFSNGKGKFRFRVYEEEDYELITEKQGFFTKRSSFTTFGRSVDRSKLQKRINNVTFDVEVELDPIIIDQTIVLKNIYYDFNKANIREDAALELDKLVTILNDNPEISIELGSHTDSRADDNYNMDLSERRARSAVDYIIESGISSNRIIARGYGESKLIIKDAQNEDEHQTNRRTEFKVVEYLTKDQKKQDDNVSKDTDFDKYFDVGDEF